MSSRTCRGDRVIFGSFIALAPRNGMKKGAADMAAPVAGGAERIALAIGEIGQRLVIAGGRHLRIVEFVTSDQRALRTQRTVGAQPCLAVAKVHLAPGEAGGMAEQAEHGMRFA